MKNIYEILKNEVVLCEYCHAHTHLYNINNHLKTKKCQRMKNIFIETQEPHFGNKYILFLNTLRKKALRGEELENKWEDVEIY